ncbi:MAG: hypothetical protein H3C45_07130, partial [Bacteroidia bacterium]|nr:hypothetical protein [Bacteroidia bacterium]
MKKLLLLPLLIVLTLNSIGQTLPLIENFENSGSWVWSPWVMAVAGTSVKSATAAHSGSYGLSATGDWSYRTDVTIGTPGQKLTWWFRFQGTGRLYFGFGASSSGCYGLLAAANTSTLLFQNNASWGYTDLTSVPQTWALNTWYKLELTFNTTTNVTGRLYATDGTTLLNTITLTIPGLVPGGIAVRGFGPAHLDDVYGGTPASSGGPGGNPYLFPPIGN